MGWFLLGPIKKPVSSSVSKSLLWHSRQLRKHLKAPEKPDNTSLVECRVPLEGRRDFAPCQRDTLRPSCVAISTLSYVLNIERPPRAQPPGSSRGATPPKPRETPSKFANFPTKSPIISLFPYQPPYRAINPYDLFRETRQDSKQSEIYFLFLGVGRRRVEGT